MNFRRSALIASVILASWFGMQQIHELGHIAAARWIGATIDHIAIHPLTISHTNVGPNRNPNLVVWAGPTSGTLLPLAIWLIAAALRIQEAFLLRFFAAFCLVANGVYIGVGSFFGIGDPGEMLRNGSPIWQLHVFGLVATLAGFVLWNGEGKHFGLGPNAKPIQARAVAISAAAAALFVVVGLLVGGK
jgi:hypothetical protein